MSHAKELKVYDITDILRIWDGDIWHTGYGSE
jgi:hypothetical protein